MAKKTSSTDNTISLSQQVLDFYQLKQQPFSNQMLDAKSIYTDSIFEQLLDNIKHQLQFTDLILFIEGDAGSGKSTLFRRLLKTETSNILLLPVQAEITDTLNSLQQKMALHLSAPATDSPIQEQLKNLQLFDQHAALVIDDAHLLSDSCFCEILDFQKSLQESSTQLKLLFFANTGTADRLGDISQLQASQLSVQAMPEFTNKQVAAFIKHSFARAGFEGNIGLSNDDIQRIQEQSQGNISQLMIHAAAQLEKHVHQQTRTPAARMARKYLIPISLIIILGIGFIAMQIMQSPPPAPPEFASPEKAAIQHEALESKPQITEPEPVIAAPETISEPATEAPAQTTAQLPAKPPAEKIQPAEIPAATVDTPQAQINKQPEATEQSIEEKAVKEVVPQTIETPAPAVQTVIAEPPKIINPAITQLEQLGIHNSQWLAQQNPEHWTLQILGARDPATLLSFAKAHKLGEDTAWYSTELKGKPWYVLVHRLYSNRDTARQSITSLPAELQKARPWAKSIKSIQQAIKK